MSKSKILKDLTLLAKYISLKKAALMVDRNLSMFDMSMVGEHLREHMGDLNSELVDIKSELDAIAGCHKAMFLIEAPAMMNGVEPTEDMRDMYLSVIHMSGGDITGCLTFLNDLIAVASKSIPLSEQVAIAIDYTRWLVKEGFLTPQVVVLSEDGMEIGREDLDELDGDVEVTRVKLTLTPIAIDLIKDVVDEVNERREELSRSLASQMSLMDMASPSRMLN